MDCTPFGRAVFLSWSWLLLVLSVTASWMGIVSYPFSSLTLGLSDTQRQELECDEWKSPLKKSLQGSFTQRCRSVGDDGNDGNDGSHQQSPSTSAQDCNDDPSPTQSTHNVTRYAVLMTGFDANAWCLHPACRGHSWCLRDLGCCHGICIDYSVCPLPKPVVQDRPGSFSVDQWLEVDIPMEVSLDGVVRSFSRFVNTPDPSLPISRSSYRSKALADRIPVPINPFSSSLPSPLPHPFKPVMTPSSEDSLDDTELERNMGPKPPVSLSRAILEKRKSAPWYVPGAKGSTAQGPLSGHDHGHGPTDRSLDSAPPPSSPVATGGRPASVIPGAAGTVDSVQDCGQADYNGEGPSFDRLTGSTLEIGLDSEADRAASGQFDKGKGRAESSAPFDQGRDSLRQSFNVLLIDTAAEHAGLLQQEMAMAVACSSVLQGSASSVSERRKVVGQNLCHYLDLWHSEQMSNLVASGRIPKRTLEYQDDDEDEIRYVRQRR
ncbi:hypothetical protein B0O80DRAFT_431967 [Mortierella sp. GBAus27b]|nr:hypothetical protein B0O80DRAFT_431967 [Mortierella sp. GBAus27b]